MAYYCGHCYIRRNAVVKTKPYKVALGIFGHKHVCPRCKNSNVLTADELVALIRKTDPTKENENAGSLHP